MQELFEQADDYEKMLEEGISISGENKFYFIKERIKHLKKVLPKTFAPKYILDFGCGTGETTIYLKKAFEDSIIIGAEVSEGALDYARKQHQQEGIKFMHVDELESEHGKFDLVYTNGVFHHIPLEVRSASYREIFQCLSHNGYLGYFENNPYNPGTNYIMKRVPFDHGVVKISYRRGKADLLAAGFKIVKCKFLFYFPRALKSLRFLESSLENIPLGGQYHLLCQKK